VNKSQPALGPDQERRANSDKPNAGAAAGTRAGRRPYVRRFVRYRTESKLVLKMLGKDGYVRIHGRCFELSEAGMGAITSSEIAVGEMASAELSIMDSPEPIAVSVVVRHRMGYRHGCEFVGLQPEQAERIRKFCRELRPAD
jgi:hypothetical protein